MAVLEPSLNRHLHELVVKIGRRPTGSWHNQRAASYLSDQLRALGLAVSTQGFPCLDWTSGEAVLVAAERKVPLRPADYSAPCDAKGPLLPIGSLEQLQESSLGGAIVFLHDSLAREAMSPKNFRFYNPLEHQALIRLLEEKQPAGIITPSLQPDQYISVIEDGDFAIPCAVIGQEHVPELFHLAGASVRLFIGSRRRVAEGHNVLARMGGEGRRAVLTAHFDTKPETPGALDNAAGTAVLLALAQYWRQRGQDVPVELVFFNGEDYFSNPGETLYFDTVLAEPGNVTWAANLDGVGLRGSAQGAAAFHWPPAWQAALQQAQQLTDVAPLEPWPQGDHMLFVLKDIPTLAFTSVNIFSMVDTVIHTVHDTLELVDTGKLVQVSRCLDHIVQSLM